MEGPLIPKGFSRLTLASAVERWWVPVAKQNRVRTLDNMVRRYL